MPQHSNSLNHFPLNRRFHFGMVPTAWGNGRMQP